MKYLKFALFVLLLLLSAYLLRDPLSDLIHPKSPREIYLRTQNRTLGRQDQDLLRWTALNDQALRNPTTATAGFEQLWHFNFSQHPATSVLSFRFDLPAGRRLSATARSTDSQPDGRLFAELYRSGTDDEGDYFIRVANWTNELSRLDYTAPTTTSYVLLIQSDLTYRGDVLLSVEEGPSLSFPVRGVSDRAAQSFWGAERDGGRRRHEGVDIFADRGTPLLASAPARVSRVREGGLGGKVVWLWSPEHQLSLYYAHLDTQWVQKGDWVEAGDTVGLVGNTGNARTTPPHLHFGIYPSGRKAVDPWPFIDREETSPVPPTGDTTFLGRMARLPERGIYYLRAAPRSDRSAILRKLEPGEEVFVAGLRERYTIVRTAAGETGYVIWD